MAPTGLQLLLPSPGTAYCRTALSLASGESQEGRYPQAAHFQGGPPQPRKDGYRVQSGGLG